MMLVSVREKERASKTAWSPRQTSSPGPMWNRERREGCCSRSRPSLETGRGGLALGLRGCTAVELPSLPGASVCPQPRWLARSIAIAVSAP